MWEGCFIVKRIQQEFSNETSYCTSPVAFVKTMQLAKSVFDTAKGLDSKFSFSLFLFSEDFPEMGITMRFLDIGGGWPGVNTEKVSLQSLSGLIRENIAKQANRLSSFEQNQLRSLAS